MACNLQIYYNYRIKHRLAKTKKEFKIPQEYSTSLSSAQIEELDDFRPANVLIVYLKFGASPSPKRPHYKVTSLASTSKMHIIFSSLNYKI